MRPENSCLTRTKQFFSEYAVSVLLVAALATPFWVPYHANPIPSFYSEWIAAFFGLLALTVYAFQHRNHEFAVPFSAWLVAALLPSVLIHLMLARSGYHFGGLTYLLYMGLAFLMMLLGRALPASFGKFTLTDTIAFGLALGALGAVFAQWTVRMETDWIVGTHWPKETGLIAQRNHHGLHLWLGVLGLGQLLLSSKVRTGWAVIGWIVLIEGMTYEGSRSVFLYALLTLMLSLWSAYLSSQNSHAAIRKLLCVGVVPLLLLLTISAAKFVVTQTDNTGISRFAPAVVAGDGRIGLWLSAKSISEASPWIGAGPGSYVRQSWLASADLPPDVTTTIPASHAHNIFLQLSAELGVLTACAVLLLLLLWIFRALKKQRGFGLQQGWILGAVPLVVLLHNQVEYSLWYMFFLVTSSVCMGHIGNQTEVAQSLRASMVRLSVLSGLALAVTLVFDYRNLEALLREPMDEIETAAKLVKATGHPLYGPIASSALTYHIPLDLGRVSPAQLKHLERAMHVAPLPAGLPLQYSNALNAAGQTESARLEKLIAQRRGLAE